MDYIELHELYHHGIKGQRWGIRNYQNEDGSLTAEGEQRYRGTAYGIQVKNSNDYRAGNRQINKQYRTNVKGAKARYKSGEISKQDYKDIKAEEKLDRNAARAEQDTAYKENLSQSVGTGRLAATGALAMASGIGIEVATKMFAGDNMPANIVGSILAGTLEGIGITSISNAAYAHEGSKSLKAKRAQANSDHLRKEEPETVEKPKQVEPTKSNEKHSPYPETDNAAKKLMEQNPGLKEDFGDYDQIDDPEFFEYIARANYGLDTSEYWDAYKKSKRK